MILKRILGFFFVISALLALESGFAFAQATTSNTVDIIVEPETYIPPFYKGAPLFSNESIIKAVAIPHITVDGVKLSSRELDFTWSSNGSPLGQYSGIGKDTLMYDQGFPPKNINLNLDVSDSNGTVLASESKTINIVGPRIIFYENSPLYGILFNRSVNYGYNLGEREELKIVAKPFYFSVPNDISEDIGYSWSVNGEAVDLAGKRNELLLRQMAQGQSGITAVSLDIKHVTRIFQFASGNFNVSFGK